MECYLSVPDRTCRVTRDSLQCIRACAMYTTHLSSQERLPRPSTPGTSDVDTPITFADRSDGDDVGNELGKDPIRPTTKPASISHENKDAPAVEVASGGLGRTPSIPVDDQNLVEWCEGDPGHPQNWKRSRKWIAIALGLLHSCYAHRRRPTNTA